MIYRFMYTAFLKEGGVTDLHEKTVKHLCVSLLSRQVFIYIESTEEKVCPEKIVGGDFIPFPDGSCFFPMIEVFHYSKPFSEEHWERKIKNKTPWVRVNYLKPEKTASYIFYHYQYQEENPGAFDKYGILYLYRNLLVHYLENPTEPETLKYEGALHTHNTPVGKIAWDKMIEAHFIPWDDPAIQNDPDGPWLALENPIYR